MFFAKDVYSIARKEQGDLGGIFCKNIACLSTSLSPSIRQQSSNYETSNPTDAMEADGFLMCFLFRIELGERKTASIVSSSIMKLRK